MIIINENFKSGLEKTIGVGLIIAGASALAAAECDFETNIIQIIKGETPFTKMGICDKDHIDFFNLAAQVGAMAFISASTARVAIEVGEVVYSLYESVSELAESYYNYSQDQIDGMVA
jgi:hypothetical protein